MSKCPAKLTAELNCLYPRWICYVTDNIGTANGGFWKGFRSHADMNAWLIKNRYTER